MKLKLLIFFQVILLNAYAQNGNSNLNTHNAEGVEIKKKIDSTVRRIQACPANASTFTKEETNGSHSRGVNYQFKTCKGIGVYIERKFSNSDSSVIQMFYEWDAQLIYSVETIWYYHGKDSTLWRGTYYFSGGRLQNYETLGHGKSEDNTWDPAVEVPPNYLRARNDVRSFLRM